MAILPVDSLERALGIDSSPYHRTPNWSILLDIFGVSVTLSEDVHVVLPDKRP
jgi:hypothetical protein